MKRTLLFGLSALTLAFTHSANAGWLVKKKIETDTAGQKKEKILSVAFTEQEPKGESVADGMQVLKSLPATIIEGASDVKPALYQEILYGQNSVPAQLKKLATQPRPAAV